MFDRRLRTLKEMNKMPSNNHFPQTFLRTQKALNKNHNQKCLTQIKLKRPTGKIDLYSD